MAEVVASQITIETTFTLPGPSLDSSITTSLVYFDVRISALTSTDAAIIACEQAKTKDFMRAARSSNYVEVGTSPFRCSSRLR
jgi:hypothetical protein